MANISAPIFGNANIRKSAQDINLNEIFADCFYMNGLTDKEGNPEAPPFAEVPSQTIPNQSAEDRHEASPSKGDDTLSIADLTISPDPNDNLSPNMQLLVNDIGNVINRIEPFTVEEQPWKAEVRDSDAHLGTNTARDRRSEEAAEAWPTQIRPGSKPRLAPSGFAGISAIGGGQTPVATVKTEPLTSSKKRRRRPDPRDMTSAQLLERRERNRAHAKRSRIRKKFLLESLQDQLSELRHDNTNLRRVIRESIPQHASEILRQCMTEESLLLMDTDIREANEESKKINVEASALPDGIGGKHQLTEPDFRLMLNLVHSQQNFTVSDPSLPDNPIVYASEGFLKLTGYTREAIIGRNCRFLQGPRTDPKMIDMIRKGVRDGVDTSVCLLNYKADGTPFWNQFFVAALRDSSGKIVNHVGVQCEVNQIPIEIMREHAKHMAVWDI